MNESSRPLWSRDRIDEFLWDTLGKEGAVFNVINAIKYAGASTSVIVDEYEAERARLYARISELEIQAQGTGEAVTQ